MSNYAVMPLTDYKNICDEIRGKAKVDGVIKSGEMPDKISKVYDAGKIALLKDSKYMKGTEYGTNMLAVDDISPIEHDLTVEVKPIGLRDVHTPLLLGYEDTNMGVTFSAAGNAIALSGTPYSEYNYIPLQLPTLVSGTKYYIGLLYINGTPEQYPISCGFMILNSMGNYSQSQEAVYGHQQIDTITMTFTNTTVDYNGCVVMPLISTEYVGIGCECTESVENISVSRYGKNFFDYSVLENSGNVTVNNKQTGEFLLVKTGLPSIPMLAKENTQYYVSGYVQGVVDAQAIALSVFYTDGTKTNIQAKTVLNEFVKFSGKTTTGKTISHIVFGASGGIRVGTTFKNIQIELGTISTEYEPCKVQTVQANADGTVTGLTSIHPNMTIISDTKNVNIECNYYRDIDTYIDNLMTDIAMTGGE